MSKLTKEQLQGISDFEVNATLADLLNVKWQISAVDDECLMVGSEVMDYCNTPNDIMPLAFERNVSIVQSEADRKHGQWCAFLWHTEDEFNDTNPLRAIAYCLILVLQEGS